MGKLRLGEVVAFLGITGWFAILLLAEHKQPLRKPVESKPRRVMRNLMLATVSGLFMSIIDAPLARAATGLVKRRRMGLLQWLSPPRPVAFVASLVLLDYFLYWWHVANHKLPYLWRSHVVHHIDLDLDSSTALRFHFGELMVSSLVKTAQIVLLGIEQRALSVWQLLLMASVMFHHSNLRLPPHLDRRLNRFIVTPRMHTIHHSIIEEETNSNWSSGLTIWDKLHGTFRSDPSVDKVIIGVPAYRQEREVKLFGMLTLPFVRQRPTWEFADKLKPIRTSDAEIESIPAAE